MPPTEIPNKEKPKLNKAITRVALLGFLLYAVSARGQEVTQSSISLQSAVERALQNYPAIRAAQAQAQSAIAGVDLARVALQPKVDFLWQQNLASRNNVFGLLLPQATIPAISGPALGTGSFASTFGSATGVLVSWEPFDFGQRKATVGLAQAASNQANSNIAVTKLDVAATAADAFLACLASDQAIRIVQANVERLKIFSQAVHVLVDNQLRPGADASRADAELAAAHNQLIQAEQNAALARATLAEAVGHAGATLVLDAGPLLELPPDKPLVPVTDVAQHPLALSQQSVLATVRARQNILAHSYYPKFNWQSALFARGSGASVDGSLKYTRGFYPDTANWATGLTLSFSPTEIFGLRVKKKIEDANYTAEQARYDQTLQRLKGNEAKAKALLDAARKFAVNAPLQLKAAQETELRIRARYQAELATITEVAEAQRLLVQAEVEMGLATLSVWRAWLAQAKANGDLQPFLDLLK
ncbi:MAG: TolC family protein [Acidobacteria bacterium]|nr:TolC family protein [Acidobacteriota bacterium]